jgi:hypothetical protein
MPKYRYKYAYIIFRTKTRNSYACIEIIKQKEEIPFRYYDAMAGTEILTV